MRLEWGHWISQHRWDFFEYQAKKNPSQQLCDTVAELEAGLEAKGEKRELKRILYLLKQAGYEPTPLHKPNELHHWNKRPLTTRPGVKAFMSPPDHAGGNLFYYFWPKGRLLHLASMRVCTLARHYVHAHQWGPLNSMPRRIETIKGHARSLDQTIREVHTDFALSRMAQSWRDSFTEEHVDAFPKDLIRQFSELAPVRHPALDLPLRSVTDEDCRTLWLQYPQSARWRIWLGCDHEIMGQIHSIRWDPDFSESQKLDQLRELMFRERRWIFDENMIRSNAQRFRDMAYLLALDGNVDSEKFAAIALEIESRGPASTFLSACLEVTARDIPNLLEKDDMEDEALCWAA
ncbi:MAG: hypothetical protein K1X67_09805 [Fimbriimonadaceae bacterium]|nr:hypothetical protein [Fimbriimonadaceae bacterium]